MLDQETRICTYCTSERPTSEFRLNTKEAAALMSPPCRSCRSGAERMRQYGMSVHDYNRLMRAQDYACAICKERFTNTPHIDHCHERGHVRGLLCNNCNSGLGFFKDNRQSLKNAIEYLTRTLSKRFR